MLASEDMVSSIFVYFAISKRVELESSYFKDARDQNKVLELVCHELCAVRALSLIVKLNQNFISSESVDTLVRLPGRTQGEYQKSGKKKFF